MTQENKELLLKDLCARLPYRVKCEVVKRSIDGEILFIRNESAALELTVDNVKELVTNDMYEIKPYLFPPENMPPKATREFNKTEEWIKTAYGYSESVMTYDSFDCLNKHHIDYRGLIPKGLANDATGLNIY